MEVLWVFITVVYFVFGIGVSNLFNAACPSDASPLVLVVSWPIVLFVTAIK